MIAREELDRGAAKARSIVDVYRDDPLLRAIRAGGFGGRCGECDYADRCGGSRARAFATSGDALGEDPACGWRGGRDRIGLAGTRT